MRSWIRIESSNGIVCHKLFRPNKWGLATMTIPLAYMDILRQEGISLGSEGVNDIGLKPEAALRALGELRKAGICVVGGEVWVESGGRMVPTYDIWSVEEGDYNSRDEYLLVSFDVSEHQISRYISHGDGVVIVIGN